MNGKHYSWERGQAMMEYAVLFPMAVGILILAGSIGYTNRMMYTDIVNAFVQPGIEETCEPIDEGPTVADLGDHRVEFCGAVYNEASDVTTITYCVQNGGDPSISHWVLGVDSNFASSIVSIGNTQGTHEDWEYGYDPTTEVTGLKFDTGYESSGGGGGNDKPNPGRGHASLPTSRDMTAMKNLNLGNMNLNEDISDYDSTARDILIMVTGQWDANEGTVTIKAGGETYYNPIRLPVQVTDNCEE